MALLVALAMAPSRGGAQNLMTNGSFHSDVASWTAGLGTLLWTNIADEGDCPASGAALISSEPASGQHYASLSQCVGVDGQANLFAQVRHMGYGTFFLRLDYYTAVNCATGVLTSAETSVVQTPTIWQTSVLSAVPPPNANALLVTFSAVDADPHGLVIDEAILSERWPLMLDGFEGNNSGDSDPCHWSP